MIVPGWIPLLVVANVTCIVLCCISGPTAPQASPPPPPHAHLYWWLLRPHQTFFHFYRTSSASDGLQLRWSCAFLVKALKKRKKKQCRAVKNKTTTNLLLLSCNKSSTSYSLIPVITDSVKQFFGLFHLLYFSVTNKKIFESTFKKLNVASV